MLNVEQIKNKFVASENSNFFEQIKNKFVAGKNSNLTQAQLSDCLVESDFFVQIPCVIDDEDLLDRQVKGLIIGCMGVFIALFFLSYIDYLKSVFKSTAVEWDVKTITAGDYSVEI